MSHRNLELVKKLHHIWSTGKTDLIADVYSRDFVGYWPKSALVPERHGHEGVMFGVQALRTAFPDWKETVVDLFYEENKVASRTIATGTHTEKFGELEPTGNLVEIHEASTFKIFEGKVVEHQCLFDELARLNALNVDKSYLRKILKK